MGLGVRETVSRVKSSNAGGQSPWLTSVRGAGGIRGPQSQTSGSSRRLVFRQLERTPESDWLFFNVRLHEAQFGSCRWKVLA